ncbi:hypothetical protein BGZ65_009908, partial [Modicella reniformis]
MAEARETKRKFKEKKQQEKKAMEQKKKAKEEKEMKMKKQQEKEKKDQEKKEKMEQEKKKKDQEMKAKEEQEMKAKEEQEKQDQEIKAKEEQEMKAKEEQEKKEQEMKAKKEQEMKAKEEQEKKDQEMKAKEEQEMKAKEEQEMKAKEEQEKKVKKEKEMKAKEEQEKVKKEEEMIAKEEQEKKVKKEQEMKAKEAAALAAASAAAGAGAASSSSSSVASPATVVGSLKAQQTLAITEEVKSTASIPVQSTAKGKVTVASGTASVPAIVPSSDGVSELEAAAVSNRLSASDIPQQQPQQQQQQQPEEEEVEVEVDVQYGSQKQDLPLNKDVQPLIYSDTARITQKLKGLKIKTSGRKTFGLQGEHEFVLVEPDLAPKQDYMDKRTDLIWRLEEILNEGFPGHKLRVKVFESFASGLRSQSSDVELCMVSSDFRLSAPYNNMTKVAQVLGSAGMTKILPISTARVPIVKFCDPKSNIQCDINSNHVLEIYNSEMIRCYTLIDDRVKPFIYTLKALVKRHNIQDSGMDYLSRYCYVMMAIGFLQAQ